MRGACKLHAERPPPLPQTPHPTVRHPKKCEYWNWIQQMDTNEFQIYLILVLAFNNCFSHLVSLYKLFLNELLALNNNTVCSLCIKALHRHSWRFSLQYCRASTKSHRGTGILAKYYVQTAGNHISVDHHRSWYCFCESTKQLPDWVRASDSYLFEKDDAERDSSSVLSVNLEVFGNKKSAWSL